MTIKPKPPRPKFQPRDRVLIRFNPHCFPDRNVVGTITRIHAKPVLGSILYSIRYVGRDGKRHTRPFNDACFVRVGKAGKRA